MSFFTSIGVVTAIVGLFLIFVPLLWKRLKSSLISSISAASILQQQRQPVGGRSTHKTKFHISGPNTPQVINYAVTTPPLSKRNIPVLASAASLQTNSCIYQTLVLDVEHMLIEQIRSRNKNERGRKNGHDNITVDKIMQDDEGGNNNFATLDDSNSDKSGEKAEYEGSNDSKKNSKLLPVSAIVNVSALKPNKCKTLVLTIDNEIMSEVKGKDGKGLLSAYNDLTNNQVTIDNWKTHGSIKNVAEQKRIGGAVRVSQNKNKSENDSIHSLVNSDEQSWEDVNTGNCNNYDDDSSSTIVSGDLFCEYSVGNIDSDGMNNRCQKPKNGIHRKYKRGIAGPDLIQREFTFASEKEAASFQTNFLAMKIVGKEIKNMYSAMESIHISNNEVSCPSEIEHDEQSIKPFLSVRNFGNQRLKNVGIYLDDIQRCLGDLPFVFKKLSNDENLVKRGKVIKRNSLITAPPDTSINTALGSSVYKDKRTKLGYLDFFHLFVPRTLRGTPYCSPTALERELHQARAKQLFELRERVAAGSTRVCTYVNAMKLVHERWDIQLNENVSTNDIHRLSRRFAFDEDQCNAFNDLNASHEFYEASTNKDARCMNDAPTHLSQAFSLIDCHVLEYQKVSDSRQNNDKLLPCNDPVDILPSLNDIVNKYPEREFFVAAFFQESSHIATVALFTRNFPRGIDQKLDNMLDSLIHGKNDFEDSLKLSIQLGSKARVSYSRLAMMQLEAFTLRLFGFNAKLPYFVWPDTNRISFPTLNLSQQTKFQVFSNSNNYFAVTCFTQKSIFNNYPKKILHDPVAQSSNVVDFIFHIQDHCRPLSTLRMVHIDPARALEINKYYTKKNSPQDLNTQPNDDFLGGIETNGNRDEEAESDNVEALKEILSCITVPIRNEGTEISPNDAASNVHNMQVLSLVSDGDLKRHLEASRFDLKKAAVRIVRCAAWRGITFPIDCRVCQIELQSNQSFCQGFDKDRNPIFYFRNMCRGIWRKDVNASVLATLHRLESATQRLIQMNENFKFTLIILMGKPCYFHDDNLEGLDGKGDSSDNRKDKELKEQNRLNPTDSFHIHTNYKLIQQLIEIVRKNYPGRLGKCLVVPNGGWEKFLGTHGLRRYVPSQTTRQKVHMLECVNDLKEYIYVEDLSVLVGGKLPVENID